MDSLQIANEVSLAIDAMLQGKNDNSEIKLFHSKCCKRLQKIYQSGSYGEKDAIRIIDEIKFADGEEYFIPVFMYNIDGAYEDHYPEIYVNVTDKNGVVNGEKYFHRNDGCLKKMYDELASLCIKSKKFRLAEEVGRNDGIIGFEPKK